MNEIFGHIRIQLLCFTRMETPGIFSVHLRFIVLAMTVKTWFGYTVLVFIRIYLMELSVLQHCIISQKHRYCFKGWEMTDRD